MVTASILSFSYLHLGDSLVVLHDLRRTPFDAFTYRIKDKVYFYTLIITLYCSLCEFIEVYFRHHFAFEPLNYCGMTVEYFKL
jgi:hypothetical protein